MSRTGRNEQWDVYVHKVKIPPGPTPTSVVMEGSADGGVGILCETNLPIPFAGKHEGAWFIVTGVAIDGDHVNISCMYQIHDRNAALKVRLSA